MSRTNETRRIKRHGACKCKDRLDATVCNDKRRWNDDKFRYECKELLTNEYVIKDLYGIRVIVNVNVISHVMLKNI